MIVVHLPETQASSLDAHELEAALAQYFACRALDPLNSTLGPIEIFLYGLWPSFDKRNLYQRLSAAHVKLKPYKASEGNKEGNKFAARK
jgi:hypothetical protein